MRQVMLDEVRSPRWWRDPDTGMGLCLVVAALVLLGGCGLCLVIGGLLDVVYT